MTSGEIRAFLAGMMWACLILILIAIGINAASAHEWYDYECCSDKDCRAVIPGDALKVNKQGYVIYGTLIKFDDKRIRKSKDQDFHVCTVVDEIGHPYVRCLYEPTTGDLF